MSEGGARRFFVLAMLFGALGWSVDAEPCDGQPGAGAADACNIPATCVDPMPERRAVMQVITPDASGIQVGTGVLVNNALGKPGFPYVLTASHLLDFNHDGAFDSVEANYFGQHAEFHFGNVAPCNGGTAKTPFVVEGASVLESDELGEVVLLGLFVDTQELIANAQPFYVGWDFEPQMAAFNVHTIHHACGDAKMVSGASGPSDFNGYLRFAGLQCGGIEPGSSGAPLFDTPTRNLIGILSGVSNGDGGVFPDGEVCAGESTDVFFAPFTAFGHQHLGALSSVPPLDPIMNAKDGWSVLMEIAASAD